MGKVKEVLKSEASTILELVWALAVSAHLWALDNDVERLSKALETAQQSAQSQQVK